MTITVHRRVEGIYKDNWGEVTVAVVVDGVCIGSHTYDKGGAVWASRNPERDQFKGLSVEALKQEGFKYSHSNAVYLDESGKRYYQDDSGTWLVEEVEAGGDYLVEDKVVVA